MSQTMPSQAANAVIRHVVTAPHLVHGCGSLDKLLDYLPLLNRPIRCITVITQPSMDRLGVTERVVSMLQGADIQTTVVRGVMPEPTIDNIEAVFQEDIASARPDAILAVGGGSVLDAAKLFAVRLTNGQVGETTPLRDWLGIDKIAVPGVPLIAVPTTAGTGSEVTPNAIVTLPDEALKVGIVSRHLMPYLVLLDATLTVSVPKAITAATGMDAFVHALESFISTKANPVSDMYAMASMRLIGANLVQAYEDGCNLAAREAMLLGSTYGGMALTAAGTAAVHALAYPLGGMFDVTHGVANAMLLPHVMAFNLDAIEPRLAEVARALTLSATSDSDTDAARKLMEQIVSWTAALQIPQDLTAYGVRDEHVDALAVAASKVTRLLGNNPKTLTLEDMRATYRRLLP
ncbi:alcohol dehydrogenase class IV [Robbsia andropogonis]|uniref:iron-containing alcohol dehydrogenase n=1 Tax=Robbsia andropogonis TaxID=28092 RepID=UPI003D1BE96C